MTDISDDYDEWDDREPDPGDFEDDDRYDEYKDDLAMGYIWPDGTQRDPDPPDDWHPAGNGGWPARLRLRLPWPRGDDPWRLPLRQRIRYRIRRSRQRPFDDEPPF